MNVEYTEFVGGLLLHGDLLGNPAVLIVDDIPNGMNAFHYDALEAVELMVNFVFAYHPELNGKISKLKPPATTATPI